jgi:predicted amidohydrolase
MVLAPGVLVVEKLGLVRPLTKLLETCRNAARKKDNASVLIFPELSNTYVAM